MKDTAPRINEQASALSLVEHLKPFAELQVPKQIGRPPRKPPTHVEIVIRVLAPSRSRRDVLAVFDGQASYEQIKKWRQGARRMPPWALDILQEKAEAFGRALVDAAKKNSAHDARSSTS